MKNYKSENQNVYVTYVGGGCRVITEIYCIASSEENAKEIAEKMNNQILSEKAQLLDALKQATERMERARGILNRDDRGNWGVLDTSDLKKLITELKTI